MKYLLDTHYLIWALADDKRLTKKVKDVITDPQNEIIVSTLSFWEISLKASLGKLKLHGLSAAELPDMCLHTGFSILSLGPMEASSFDQLKPTYHRDPFDRMLVWLAICNGYTLITADSQMKNYRLAGLKVLS